MSSRALIGLFATAVLLAGTIVVLSDPAPVSASLPRLLPGLSAARIDAIRLIPRSGPPLALVQRDGSWWLKTPRIARADGAAVQRLLAEPSERARP